MSKRLLGATAAAALSAAALVVAGPATSAQAACNNNFVSGPNNSSGSVQVRSGAVWHTGPAASYCTYSAQSSGLAYVQCYTTNTSSGYNWYLLHDATSGQVGWVYSGYISSSSGSINHC